MKEAKDHSEKGGFSPEDAPPSGPSILLEALRPYVPLLRAEAPLLLGFSGGPDSLALALALKAALGEGGAPLLALHVDHGWGPESARMAEKARRLARSMAVPFRLRRAGASRGETGARAARYRVFAEVAREEGAAALFLAHHRDDDLETLLHRLIRGTGPLGLACIPRTRELGGAPGCRVHRPFLKLSKQTLREALLGLDLEPVQDPSNASPDLSIRHRIRHTLLPRMIAEGHGPRLAALLDEADLLREAVEAEVRTALRALPEGLPLPLPIPLDLLSAMSPWGREELLIRLLPRLVPQHRRPERKHLRHLQRLLAPGCPSGRRMESLGYWILERRRDMLVLRPAPGPRSAKSKGC